MISGGIEVKVFCCFQKVWNENIGHTWFYLLRTNPTKWSNTLKQFVYNFPRNFLSVSDHFKNWHYLLRLLWWLFNLFFIVPKISGFEKLIKRILCVTSFNANKINANIINANICSIINANWKQKNIVKKWILFFFLAYTSCSFFLHMHRTYLNQSKIFKQPGMRSQKYLL